MTSITKKINFKPTERIIAAQFHTNIDSIVSVEFMILDEATKTEKLVGTSDAIQVSNFAVNRESPLFTPSREQLVAMSSGQIEDLHVTAILHYMKTD